MHLDAKISAARAEAADRFDSIPELRQSLGVPCSIGRGVLEYQAAKEKFLAKIEAWEREQHRQKQNTV